MNDVTRILNQIHSGDPHAAKELLPLVYDELRKLAAVRLAQEQSGQTLQATALVHEAYLKLAGPGPARRWQDRGHFYAAASEAMRRILIDRARMKHRQKRDGGLVRVSLPDVEAIADGPAEELLALDDALEKLALVHPVKADLVKLRYFAGLSEEDAAAALGMSRATASRHWTFARAWLIHAMEAELG